MMFEISDDQVDGLCNRLQSGEAVVAQDKSGKRLFFVPSHTFAGAIPDTSSILVAYEGQGAFLWEIHTKPNTFRLIEGGFGLTLAPTLSDILSRMKASFERLGVGLAGGATPRLEARKGE